MLVAGDVVWRISGLINLMNIDISRFQNLLASVVSDTRWSGRCVTAEVILHPVGRILVLDQVGGLVLMRI